MSSKITVGKIVANATEKEWSQAYHAGGFTAVLSVNLENPSGKEEHSLQVTGKKLLDTLVSEYFTLTTKDLETVRSAVEATMSKAPESAEVSLVVAAVVKNVLYAVVAGAGRVLLKRGSKIGMLVGLKNGDSEKIASVSGFLENNDIVFLSTPAFTNVYPHDELESVFDNKTAEELAETIAPRVHEAQNGAASALVFSFHEEGGQENAFASSARDEEHETHETKREKLREEKESASETQEKAKQEDNFAAVAEKAPAELPGFEKPLPSANKPKLAFSHRQKLFLTVTVILGIVLIGSVFVFMNRQQAAKQQALFQSLYMPAKTKYDEAQGVMDLNKALALEDLQSAKSQLQAAKGKFPANSTEEKQIDALLSQVTTSLTNAQKIPLLSATKATDGASPLLSFAKDHTGMYVTQDTTNFYAADNTAITQYDKKTQTAKKLITNGTDWKQIGGFDTYFGNFYVADTKDGIDKYVSGGSGYGKSAYFASGVSPDLSKVVSLSIDSSIYVLTSDGTISKYTKGSQDTFSVTGLDMPLKNPTEILTSADLDNIYVLDNGNSRVVVLKKDGGFVAQYASDGIKAATAIDVSEKNKKLYFLSGGTVYQLDLK